MIDKTIDWKNPPEDYRVIGPHALLVVGDGSPTDYDKGLNWGRKSACENARIDQNRKLKEVLLGIEKTVKIKIPIQELIKPTSQKTIATVYEADFSCKIYTVFHYPQLGTYYKLWRKREQETPKPKESL